MLDGTVGKKRYVDASRAALILLIAIGVDLVVVQFLLASVVTAVASLFGLVDSFYLSMILNICIQISFLVVIALFMKNKRLVFSPRLKKRDSGHVNGVVVASLVGVVVVLVCLYCFYAPAIAFDILLTEIGFSMDSFLIEMTAPGEIAIAFFAIVIAAPICEELLFRGVLLSGMKKSEYGTLTCVLLNGLAFSLMHMSPVQTVYQFALGCALALVTLKSGSLIPAIIMHAANNFLALTMGFWGDFLAMDALMEFVFSSFTLALILTPLLAAAGVAALVFLSRLIERMVKKYQGEDALTLEDEPAELIAIPVYAPAYYPNQHNIYINNNAFNQPQNPYQTQQPNPPVYPNQTFQPIYPSQTGQPVYPNQTGQPIYPNQTGQPIYPNQPYPPIYPNQATSPAYSSQYQNPYQAGYSNPYGGYPTYTYAPKNARDPKGRRNFGLFYSLSLTVCGFVWGAVFVAILFFGAIM